MKGFQKFISKLFQSNRFLKLFSLGVAFCVWVVVATTIDPYITISVRDVPVDMETQTAALSRLGLNVISVEPVKVDVEVRGKRYIVGQLRPEAIKVAPKLTMVTTSGTQSLLLEWQLDGTEEYTVQSITPQSASVRIDRLETRTFDIQAHVSGVNIAEGYLKEDEIVMPDKITLIGPVSDLNRVAHAIVDVQVQKTLSSTENITGDIVLVDSDGNPVGGDHIQKDYDTAQVTIPVLKERVVPLRIDFLNTPPGFPLEELSYVLSNETINVAGPQALVDSYNEIRLGHVDFKTLELGSKEVFDVSLPSGFVNVDNILSVSVTFETTGFVSQNFNISQISVMNGPANYDVKINSQFLSNVKVIGPKDTLATMTAEDLVAEIDISDREVVTGQIKVPVKIYAPGKGPVWVSGEYVTLVTISEK